MTENRTTGPLVVGLQKAAIHFSKAALEVVSGVGDLVTAVAHTVRPVGDDDDADTDGPQKIEIQ